jgi:hypothetical protein
VTAAMPDTPISQAVHVMATQPIHGCTAPRCGTQNTVTLHPTHGRRCPDHTVHPSGSYRPGFAADLVDAGRPDVAFRYLRTWLARQCDIRFAGARIRLALREELER